MEQARDGAPDELWVRADRQTKGRGRHGRAWVSEPGNFFASTLVRLRPADLPASQLAFTAAFALSNALEGWIAADRLSLKWPNDVLLDGAKLSGILLERDSDAVVIGFGVNLESHPQGIEGGAISVRAAGITPPSPEILLDTLALVWRRCIEHWREHGFETIRNAWIARAHKPGTPLAVRLADGQMLNGTYDGLEADGALILRLPDGETRAIHAGDIFTI